jgi:hypothetical protein
MEMLLDDTDMEKSRGGENHACGQLHNPISKKYLPGA